MRKFLIATALVVGLVACTAQQQQDINTVVAQVQAKVTEICNYVPDVAPLITIITQLATQGAVDGGALAQRICDAVTAKALVPGECPKVEGVCITGHFKDK